MKMRRLVSKRTYRGADPSASHQQQDSHPSLKPSLGLSNSQRQGQGGRNGISKPGMSLKNNFGIDIEKLDHLESRGNIDSMANQNIVNLGGNGMALPGMAHQLADREGE